MGWLWSSSPKPSAETPENDGPGQETGSTPSKTSSSFGLTDEQRTRIFGLPPSQPQSNTKSTREERPDAELDAFLKSFTTTSDAPASGQPTPNTLPEQPSQQWTAPVQGAVNGNHPEQDYQMQLKLLEAQRKKKELQNQKDLHIERTDYDRIRPDGTLNIHPSAIYPMALRSPILLEPTNDHCLVDLLTSAAEQIALAQPPRHFTQHTPFTTLDRRSLQGGYPG